MAISFYTIIIKI